MVAVNVTDAVKKVSRLFPLSLDGEKEEESDSSSHRRTGVAAASSTTEPQQTSNPVSEKTHSEPFTLVVFVNGKEKELQ